MKTFIYRITGVLLFLLAGGASASQLVEQTYEISDVREVYAASGIKLEIIQGDRESLSLKTSPAILKRVHVDLSDHRLSLNVDSGLGSLFNWFDKNDISFFMVVKNVDQLDLSGGVEAKIGKLDLDKLTVKNSGGSETHFTHLQVKDISIDTSGGASISVGVINSDKVNVQLSGGAEFDVDESSTTHFLRIDASGGSEYKAKKLKSQVAEVRAGGAAEVDLSVAKTLKVTAGGASSVNYYGAPSVMSDIGGASELTGNH